MSTSHLRVIFSIIILLGFEFSLYCQVFSEDLIPINIESSLKNELITIDVDGDSDLDIIHRGTVLTLYLNQGNFEYENKGEIYDGTEGSFDVYDIADFNSDGFADLLFFRFDASTFDQVLTLVKSNGDGSFELEDIQRFNTFIDQPIFTVGDLDNDGDIDFTLHHFIDERFEWYENNNGVFESFKTIVPSLSSLAQVIPEIFDFDKDGNLDVVLSYLEGPITWFKNNGNNDFEEEQVIFGETLYTNSEYKFLDYDSDGDTDVLQAFEEVDSLAWLRNDGGDFTRLPFEGGILFGKSSLSIGDVDNDGDIDFVIGATAQQEFRLYSNDGQGNYETSILRSDIELVCRSKIIDLNGDSAKDLLITYLNNSNEVKYGIFGNVIRSSKISSCTFFDENENGIREVSERSLGGVQLNIDPNDIKLQTNNDGCFSFFVNDGIYKVSPIFQGVWELTSDSASYTVNIEGNSISNLDFGFFPTRELLAGQMHTVSGITRCNRNTKFDFIFQNMGTTIIEEGIIWAFPDSLTIERTEIDPLDTLVNDYQWGWKFEDLYPGETIKRSIELEIPGLGGDIEPGTLIEMFSATEATDTQNFTNFFKHDYESEILCAYDPNDKLVRPDREGDENYTQFKDTLIYTVRFQNTGNDTAFTVVVRDTLDPNLDVSTFNILGSSHRDILRTEILEDQYVTFSFEDILLPDSTINFNGSQGYVVYSIEPKEGLEENTIIENTASIYFDFNPQIVTNSTQNTMVECLPIQAIDISVVIEEGETYTLPDGDVVDESGVYTTQTLDEDGCPIETIITVLEVLTNVSDLPWNNYVTITPNPSSGDFQINIDIDQNINHHLVIYDVHGKEVYSELLTLNTEKVNVQDLEPGVYFAQIKESEGQILVVRKLVVM